MNQAHQEKYNEARHKLFRMTRSNVSNEDIDVILSIFSTVPKLTLEQASEIRAEYFRRVGPDGIKNAQEIMLQVINAVLAKHPVIASAPADGNLTEEQIEQAASISYVRFNEVRRNYDLRKWDELTIAERNDWKDAVEAGAPSLQYQSKPADGMVSLKDVENAIRAKYDEGCIALANADCEVEAVLSFLTKKKKPDPTVTLLDPTGGPSMEVPASVVHEESAAQLDWDDQHGRNEVKPMEYQEAVTYTHKRIYDSDADICNLCGSVVVNQAKHTAFHGRAAR